MLANMTAAYMTIGDSRVVDYWYAFMGRLGLTFVSELLPGLIAWGLISIWFLYRIVLGMVRMNKEQPVE